MMLDPKPSQGKFSQQLETALYEFLDQELGRYPVDEVLKIDLHCHDYNSDVPDELLGRILNVPESWLKTEQLLKELKSNGCDVITITNHNNARSCYELQDQGIDTLTGAEFSCHVPDYNIGIHVLTYGFSKEQEIILNQLRRNIYNFQEYTCANNLPTIWAHPLYSYTAHGVPPIEFFMKLSLIFERFEVVNGQRDTWQNLMFKEWIDTFTPDKTDMLAQKFNINPTKYCKNPYKKVFTGGSDSHFGLFAGQTGSYLHVPGLQKRLQTQPKTELALEALRYGRIIPYGSHNNYEKLTIGLLSYVFQIALHYKDPGLLRILLHKGTVQDKILALIVSNGFAEVQRHKTTMRFIKLFHNCFQGKIPSFTNKWLVPKAYKSIYNDAISIAECYNTQPFKTVSIYYDTIVTIHHKLISLLFTRFQHKLENMASETNFVSLDFNYLLSHFELPSELRTLLEPDKKKSGNNRLSNIDLPKFMDGLSFPFLASALILAANYTSSKVLYNTRELLSTFATITGKYKYPSRMLWLTDTYGDTNGVSTVLKLMLDEIRKNDLPIDLLICSATITSGDHLIVVKPEIELTLPFYKQQPLRIPNFLTIQQLFQQGEYDRIMCSTEGPMGLAAIYLKYTFSVKAYFYVHTDWIVFARKVLNIDLSNLNRFRRILRTYYRNFDSLFVLNTDQQKWLTSTQMGFHPDEVHITAHWVGDTFQPVMFNREEVINCSSKEFVVLYSGRLSEEKGVQELPEIYHYLKYKQPNTKLVVAGSGPAENDLKTAMPDAIFLGWVDHQQLPAIYSSSDILILPSKFDTFGNSVLESMACSLPVIAYNVKGPKDIIQHGINGFLVKNIDEMKENINRYIANKDSWHNYKKMALLRAAEYNKTKILNQLLKDTGFDILINE